MEKKSNHQANIVRLGEPRIHTNADTLELYDIGGYQVVTKKNQFKAGDLAIYIQPDSVVPQTEPFKFIWEQYVEPPTVRCTNHTDDPSTCNVVADEPRSVPERKRRITVRKFRKEWSEGLLLPLTDFPVLYSLDDRTLVYYPNVFEGDDVSVVLGITHWEGDVDTNTGGDNESRPRRKFPKTMRGWFYFILFKLGVRGVHKQVNEELSFEVPKFDVEALKNYKSALVPDELVFVTEKIHGSQGRYTFRDGKMYAGSRNFWKRADSPCVWRKALAQNPWIEEYCRLYEGRVLYGEVVPTQKNFHYGCAKDEVKFFVFDIRNEKGDYIPKQQVFEAVPNPVPLLHYGPYSDGLVKKYVDGISAVKSAKNAREGVVVTAADPLRYQRGLGRVQLKVVSNSFLEKDTQ